MTKNLSQIIENAFEKRAEINLNTSLNIQGEIRDAVNETLALLDAGKIRICEKENEIWQVNQWIKNMKRSDHKLSVVTL